MYKIDNNMRNYNCDWVLNPMSWRRFSREVEREKYELLVKRRAEMRRREFHLQKYEKLVQKSMDLRPKEMELRPKEVDTKKNASEEERKPGDLSTRFHFLFERMFEGLFE